LVFVLFFFNFLFLVNGTAYSACNGAVGSGSHTLTQNVSSTGDCFTFSAANVEFDCQGFTVDGDDSGNDFGFWNDYNNVTIKNCKVKDFLIGILYNGGDNGEIYNVDTSSNTNSGTWLQGGAFGNVIHSVVANSNPNNGVALISTSGDNNILYDIYASGNGNNGISVESDYNTVNNYTGILNGYSVQVLGSYNNFTNMDLSRSVIGVLGGTGDFNRYINITSYNNSDSGLALITNADDTHFENILVQNLPNYGLYIDADRSTVFNYTIINTTSVGMVIKQENHTITNVHMDRTLIGLDFQSSSNNVVENITSINNVWHGLYLEVGANNNKISNGYFASNAQVGFGISNSHYNVLDNITVTKSGGTIYAGGYFHDGSAFNNITNSNISDNVGVYGLRIWSGADDNYMSNLIIRNNTYGVSFEEVTNNTLINSVIELSPAVDLYVTAIGSEIYCDNEISNVTGTGGSEIFYSNTSVNLTGVSYTEIFLCDADNSIVDDVYINSSVDIGNNGFFIYRTDNSVFTNINSGTNFHGFQIILSNNTVLTDTYFYNNTNHGIAISSANKTYIENTISTYNGDYGLYMSYADNTQVNQSNFVYNNNSGIYLYYSDINSFNYVNTSFSNANGVYVFISNNLIFDGLFANDNLNTGLMIAGSNNTQVYSSKMNNNTLMGIALNSVYSSIFDNVETLENNNTGNLIFNCYNSTFTDINSYLNLKHGVLVNRSSGLNFTNLFSYNNNGSGIYFVNSSNNDLKNAILENSTVGVNLLFREESKYNNVVNVSVRFSGNNTGVYLNESSYNNFTDIYSHNNDINGFVLNSNANYNIFENIYAYNNNNSGFGIALSSNNKIINFNSYGNLQYGIVVLNSTYNLINRTLINNSKGDNGIYVNDADYNSVYNARIESSGYHGLSLASYSSFNYFENLTLLYNNKSGIYSAYSSDNEFVDIVSNNNNEYGIILELLSNNNSVDNLDSRNNGLYGLYCKASVNNNLTNSYLYNSEVGAVFFLCVNAKVLNVSSFSNNNSGLIFTTTQDSVIDGLRVGNNVNNNGLLIQMLSHFNNFSNIVSTNNLDGVYIHNSSQNNFVNVNISSSSERGFTFFGSASYNNVTNISLVDNKIGMYFLDGGERNIILNSSLMNNTQFNLYFNSSNSIYPQNNYFSNNHFGNGSLVSSYNWLNTPQFFNSSKSGYNLGNYWNGINCIDSVVTGNVYQVCTNPDYLVDSGSSLYDYMPLIPPPVPYYIFPSPYDGDKVSKLNVTINLHNDGLAILGCNVTINSVVYNMTYSGGICSYTFTNLGVNKGSFVYNVTYSHATGTAVADTRTFLYYPSREILLDVPAVGFMSGVLMLLLVLFGLIYN
ncbi:MAG: right-handed parallel beta-helix repeat-containing protein, partial [Nanoarchaeota archaeon]|nr:right-handed parallel beta-helix repeat-containing protein [Nanoarchaeota archaeon]